MTKRIAMIGLACAAIGACSEPAAEAPAAPAAAKMQAGEWEVTSTVEQLQVTEGPTAATSLKVGDKATVRACVPDSGEPPAELFANAGQECRTKDRYVRPGRLSLQLTCEDPKARGQILPGVDGKTTAETMDATLTTTTYLVASGDYRMVQKLAGRRVGDCPAGGAAAQPGNAAG